MTYKQLENLQKENNKKVCIYGAGNIGRTWGYDIILSAGFQIAGYYDSKLDAQVEIRDGVKTIDFATLCAEKDSIIVFIAVSEKFHSEIIRKLEANGIVNYYALGFAFLQEFCESVLRTKDVEIIQKYKCVVDDKEYLRRQFKYKLGYELNLENTITFNEKLQWLKIHDRNPEYTRLVDKYEFKEYIKKEIGEEYVIPTIGVWNSVDDIEWDQLPNQFVLKCTHDSGSIIICKDKTVLNKQKVKYRLSECLKRSYYYFGREWPYKKVKPRIIAEKYIIDESNAGINDYKFFVFNGKVKLIQVDYDRFAKHQRNLYTTDWKYVDLMIEYPTDATRMIEKPKQLDKIVEMVESISQGIPHVRIDMYLVNDAIYFGEMTFYHGSGYERFEPQEWGNIMGDWIEI